MDPRSLCPLCKRRMRTKDGGEALHLEMVVPSQALNDARELAQNLAAAALEDGPPRRPAKFAFNTDNLCRECRKEILRSLVRAAGRAPG